MHEHFEVVLINEKGEIVGSKPRVEINKRKDLFWTVYIFLFDEDNNLGLSVISSDNNKLPNLYAGKFGITTASIVRKDEMIQDTATRSLRNELGLKNIALSHIGDTLDQIGEQSLRKMSVFAGKLKKNEMNINKHFVEDIKFVSLSDIQETLADNDAFAASFIYLWGKYKDQILNFIRSK